MTGLRCWVYKNGLGDCTNGGISAKCDTVVLLGHGPVEATADAPAVKLVQKAGGYLCAVPVDQPANAAGPMFGGHFIHTSDQRFPCDYPIPLHDRFESWDLYRMMSSD